MLRNFDYVRPRDLEEALDILHRQAGARPMAGGTNLLVDMRAGRATSPLLVDIGRLEGLRYIRSTDGEIRIGAAATHSDLATSPYLTGGVGLLARAASLVGSPQIRNRGTIGGNIADASPAADTLPPLIALGAVLRLRSRERGREVAAEDLMAGPGQTVLRPNEIITEIGLPRASGVKGAFIKLGLRNALAISVASVAVALRVSPQGVEEARIALGAVAPTVVRARSAEALLVGQAPTPERVRQAAEAAAADISPISDIRASAEYRRAVTPVLVRRAIQQALEA